MIATELLKLAVETEEGRKERLKKMVANHSAEASPRQRMKEELDWNICQITQSIHQTTYNCSILRGVIINKVD